MMLKAVIADDEQLICRMLEKMIDWNSKNIEVAGLAHNGQQVLELIEKEKPDIIITDICMPGIDGLQIVQKAKERGENIDFIIMSGYKNFEYAHTALNLGVKHYLLKPISKKELDEILERIIAERMEITAEQEKIHRLEKNAVEGKKKIRKHFLNNIIKSNLNTRVIVKDTGQSELTDIETSMNCDFKKECFHVLFTKVDANKPNGDITTLLNDVDYIIERVLDHGEWEYINSYVNSGVVTILNYHEGQQDAAEQAYGEIIEQCQMELDKFSGFYITLGTGSVKYSIAEVQDSVREAITAIQCRLKKGVNRIIRFTDLKYKNVPLETILTPDDRREFENIIEALDADFYMQKFVRICEKIENIPNHSPEEVFHLIESLKEQILEIWNENHISKEICQEFEKEIQYVLDFNIDEKLLENSFDDDIGIYFERVCQENQKKSQLPVRMAKQYIQQNYAKAITLEEVAAAISLSPAYLSTLFKKEIGIKFSDYLISCRMDEAKKRLKHSEDPINIIAEAVGYTDSKYFSKTFYKVVGLKPSEYRRLYQ